MGVESRQIGPPLDKEGGGEEPLQHDLEIVYLPCRSSNNETVMMCCAVLLRARTGASRVGRIAGGRAGAQFRVARED